MIALDTNLLIYAHRTDSPFYTAANRGLQQLIKARQPWGIPLACLHEFLAVVTNPRVFNQPSNPPTPQAQAIDQIDAWLEIPNLQILHSGATHWQILHDVLQRSSATGGQIHDARIAAICLENGVSMLWTADRDFAKFKPLKCSNPLLELAA